MRLLLILCLLAAGTEAVYPVYQGPSLQEVVDQLDYLQCEVRDCLVDLSTLATSTQVGIARVKKIQDNYLPILEEDNVQQDNLIAKFTQQVKDITHDVDDARADCEATQELAKRTQQTIRQQQQMTIMIYNTDKEQIGDMDQIDMDLSTCKMQQLNQLDTFFNLTDSIVDDLCEFVQNVGDFLDSRHCEQGLLYIYPGETVNVTYKTVFQEEPDLAFNLVGMLGHLGTLSSDSGEENVLGFDKKLLNDTIEGFTLGLDTTCTGDVQLSTLYYSWRACQNVNASVSPLDL